MKFYVHVRNEEIFFNVRALSFDSAVKEVDKILDFLGWEHDFSVHVEELPLPEGTDFQLRINRQGQLKGACYDSIKECVVYDKYLCRG